MKNKTATPDEKSHGLDIGCTRRESHKKKEEKKMSVIYFFSDDSIIIRRLRSPVIQKTVFRQKKIYLNIRHSENGFSPEKGIH